MRATLKTYRQSPRKVRLIADLVRGKTVSGASKILEFSTKQASYPIIKLLNSAVANARNQGVDAGNLYISEIKVDKGLTIKRFMPRARGRAAQIKKRTSHVTLVLSNDTGSSVRRLQNRRKATSYKLQATS